MTSSSFQKFRSVIKNANGLDDSQLIGSIPLSDRQVFYHASISMDVAAWDAYINSIIVEYLESIGDFTAPSLMNMRKNALAMANARLRKFNTPNFDNCRTLILEITGFDTVGVWAWPRRKMIWQTVQSRLNEVLKIRHSFAHGFPISNISWLPQRNGYSYLNRASVNFVESLLIHLAQSLDDGLGDHLNLDFPHNARSWR